MSVPRTSERMRAIASIVLPGRKIADIGTDHGFIPAALLLEGTVPFAVLTDINPGPLEKCRANLDALGVDPSLYEIRMGDGFEAASDGGYGTVIAAGMGGELITRFFENMPQRPEEEAFCIADRFVLQPRTHEEDLRSYLTQSGFSIRDYRLAKERGRICEVFAAEPCAAGSFQPDSGLISAFLLEKGDRLLCEYVDAKIDTVRAVLDSLKNSNTSQSEEQKSIFAGMLAVLTDIRNNL